MQRHCRFEFSLLRCHHVNVNVSFQQFRRDTRPTYCDICMESVANFNQHMHENHPGCGGHSSSHGYRSNGRYLGGWFGGICGTGSPYYLLCQDCHNKYITAREERNSPIIIPEK